MRHVIVAVLVVFILISIGLSGCIDEQPGGKISTEERFIGTWKDEDFSGQEWVFTFSEDGSYDTNRTIPGTWTIINQTHVDLAINNEAVTYRYSFSDSYQKLTLESTGFADMNWKYELQKIE